jgi:hypothetical protein
MEEITFRMYRLELSPTKIKYDDTKMKSEAGTPL